VTADLKVPGVTSGMTKLGTRWHCKRRCRLRRADGKTVSVSTEEPSRFGIEPGQDTFNPASLDEVLHLR
jgi:hypothetical protein